jgi:MFS family permease
LTVLPLRMSALSCGHTSVMGAVVAEIFQGKHFGSIFGTVMLAALAGGAAGPWITGLLYDATGSYAPAFWICIALSVLSALAIWLAAPRKVRAVAGQMHRIAGHERSRLLSAESVRPAVPGLSPAGRRVSLPQDR